MYKAMVAGWVAGLVAGWVAGWPAGRNPPPPPRRLAQLLSVVFGILVKDVRAKRGGEESAGYGSG